MYIYRVIRHYFIKWKQRLKVAMREQCRKLKMRSLLKHTQSIPNDISIFCNNCITGCVCHDFGLRFNSPTVNLIIKPSEYVEFLANIEYYKDINIEEFPDGYFEYSCPVGIIDNKIKIYFLHYSTFKEAKESWERRCRRINLDNLYFVMSEKDGCTYSDLQKFDKLDNCKKKVVFVHKQYDGLNNAYIVNPDANNPNEALTLTDWRGWFGKREYDVYNWLTWLSER